MKGTPSPGRQGSGSVPRPVSRQPPYAPGTLIAFVGGAGASLPGGPSPPGRLTAPLTIDRQITVVVTARHRLELQLVGDIARLPPLK